MSIIMLLLRFEAAVIVLKPLPRFFEYNSIYFLKEDTTQHQNILLSEKSQVLYQQHMYATTYCSLRLV